MTASPGDRVACVDMARVHDEAPSAAYVEASARLAKLQAESGGMLHPMFDPRRSQGNTMFLSPAPKADLKRLHAEQQMLIDRQHATKLNPKADDALAAVADRDGFTIVVDASAKFYRGSATDITDRVIALLRDEP